MFSGSTGYRLLYDFPNVQVRDQIRHNGRVSSETCRVGRDALYPDDRDAGILDLPDPP
jgi:hypothetical protein